MGDEDFHVSPGKWWQSLLSCYTRPQVKEMVCMRRKQVFILDVPLEYFEYRGNEKFLFSTEFCLFSADLMCQIILKSSHQLVTLLQNLLLEKSVKSGVLFLECNSQMN